MGDYDWGARQRIDALERRVLKLEQDAREVGVSSPSKAVSESLEAMLETACDNKRRVAFEYYGERRTGIASSVRTPQSTGQPLFLMWDVDRDAARSFHVRSMVDVTVPPPIITHDCPTCTCGEDMSPKRYGTETR